MSGHSLARPHTNLKDYVEGGREEGSAGDCGGGGGGIKDGDAAVVVAQLVESLPSMFKALGSILRSYKLGVSAHLLSLNLGVEAKVILGYRENWKLVWDTRNPN